MRLNVFWIELGNLHAVMILGEVIAEESHLRELSDVAVFYFTPPTIILIWKKLKCHPIQPKTLDQSEIPVWSLQKLNVCRKKHCQIQVQDGL